MNGKNDLFWGILIGLIGNLLVSTAFAMVEHPEWSLFLNPLYFGSWIAILVFCLFLVFTRNPKKKVESKKQNTENEEEPTEEDLRVEYQVLNEAVNKRGSDTLLVDSIMIPSSLVIVTFAIKYRSDLGRNILFNMPNAGFVPLLSLILILVPYFLWYTTTKLDDVYFDRIHQLENLLHIKGHRSILEQIKCDIWYKIRRSMWHLVYLVFVGTYLFTAYWLFRETILA